MDKLKINKIDIGQSLTAKQISKNILSVVEFQTSLAADLNRVIDELNIVLSAITTPTDDSELLSRVIDLESKPEPESFNDAYLRMAIKKQNDKLTKLQEDIEQLMKISKSNQIEIRSNRQESGLAIDRIEQKILREAK